MVFRKLTESLSADVRKGLVENMELESGRKRRVTGEQNRKDVNTRGIR